MHGVERVNKWRHHMIAKVAVKIFNPLKAIVALI